MIINLFFFLLYIFISKLNCLYNNDIAETTLNINKKLGILYSNKNTYLNFNDEIKRNLLVGEVYEELLNDSNKYIFNFNKLDIKKNNLYFYFYPLDDCHIKITSNDNLVKIQKEKYYNSYLFYTQINSRKKLYSISYKIEPINYLSKDSNSTCHLIINSFYFSNNNIPKLNLKEKSSTFLHFDKNLRKIRLFYNLPKEKNESIVFSFFIKDKVKFNVAFEQKYLNKTISYIDKFIITKDLIPKNTNNISILLTLKEEDKVSDVIVRVIGDNSTFYYLQRNFLNLEFILSEENTKYYIMEVYKDEEGEIILHDKRKNGKLVSKIFNQERLPQINDFKNISNKSDDEFDNYSQKLTFNTTDCKNLTNKCYMLITYFGSYNLFNVTGSEYTILTRVWDKTEIIPQIVNIPLNEYVFGTLEEKSVNHHYYTVFIPEDYEKISLEIHGYGINIYAINGIKKINRKYIDVYDLKFINRTNIITLSKSNFSLTSFKNRYISFSVFRNDTKLNKIINYYFRVLHADSINNNIIFYPLDSNVENLCFTKLISNHYSCYFLLKNDYNELSHNLIINELYDNAENYSYTIISKKEEDYYSINLKYRKFDNFLVNLDKDKIFIENYVIIRIDSKFKNNSLLTISSGFSEIEPSIQIYSYKLIYLLEKNKTNFDLDNKTKQFKLRVINNTPEKNKIEISFYKNNTTKADINNDYGKHFSCLIEEFTKLEFSCRNDSIIYLKFDYKRVRQNLVEINYYNSFIPKLKTKDFPIIFYIKDFFNNGIDFNIYYGSKIENLDMTGYVLDFLDIEKLDEGRNKTKVDYHHLIKGIYDDVTQTGVIEFNKFNDPKVDFKDIYYVIEIFGDSSNIIQDSNIFIYSNPKENSKFKIPIGKYIRGIFNSTENDKQQIYYTEQNKDNYNALTIIELSSNYKNVELSTEKFNFKFKKVTKDYAQIYIIEGLAKEFTIKLEHNDNSTINNSLLIVNYIFKYYYAKDFNETNYIPNVECNYTHKKAKENQTKVNILITCNNSQKNNSNTLNYSYYLRLYQNNNRIDDEELNTLAITFSQVFYYSEYQTNSSTFNFSISDISVNDTYLGYLFIKENYSDYSNEIYKLHNFTINVLNVSPLKNKDNSNFLNKNNLILIIIIGIVIIILIILTITLIIMKKKNIELEEQVSKISFADRIDSESEDEFNKRVSYI